MSPTRVASYLSVLGFHRLDSACRPIRDAFGTPPYLVGSVNERPDYRDVDVRLILLDAEYDRLTVPEWSVIGLALSAYLRDATHLPVDFQVQRMTEANERHPGTPRNPLGMRNVRDFVGDGAPTPEETP